MWVAAIDFLRNGLIDADGQYHLACGSAGLHVFEYPGMFFEDSRLQLFGLQVVEREGYLFVFVVVIVVVDAEVGLLLGSHHAFHQLYGRVVLTAVLVTLLTDDDLADGLVVWLQGNVECFLGLRVDGNDTCGIAHGTDRDVPAFMTGDGITSVVIGNGGDMMSFINDAGIGDAVTRLCIGDDTRYCLCSKGNG